MPQQPNGENDSPLLLEPSAAMRQLGVSASGLRRLGQLYEQVHGQLPRKVKGSDRGNARLWPMEAIGRLRDARRLLEQGRSSSIVEALEALQQGVTPDDAPDWLEAPSMASQDATAQALRLLLEEVAALRAEVSAQRSEIADLKSVTVRQRELETSPKGGFMERFLKRWRRVRAAITESDNNQTKS